MSDGNAHSGQNVYENACCVPSAIGADGAFDAWVNSPAHLSNMLAPDATEVGYCNVGGANIMQLKNGQYQ